ncbi:ABC transporter permease [Fulvivirgaceae bacterium BMA10]|uniref:ABC transporter permease n=1 Tax=Splendidivirga corallicola TaxID=3051826 RepID=A0ABT8KL90_9BACT|nr:ABC transporter permease [Fulvivirgaceae bacterium BMA10]
MKSNKHTPPKRAERFLLWFLRRDLVEEVLGDLDEKFYQTLEEKSVFKAKLNYWYQVINYLRPFAITKSRSINSNHYAMFRNYFKIGYRNLYKNKGYSFINIGGLAIGLAVAMLIGLWLHDELSYNKYHENYEHIVKVLRNDAHRGKKFTSPSLVRGLGPLFRDEYGNHFKHVVMVRARIEERVIANEDKMFTQAGYFMEPDGPEMFGLNMIYGTRDGLSDMNSILLSKSVADKLFGDTDPLNKVVKMDARWDLKVTGVYEDLPLNSELKDATYFAPLKRFLEGWSYDDVWTNQHMYIYAQLNPESDPKEVSSVITDAMLDHIPRGTNNAQPELFLHPMPKWHLYSAFENGTAGMSDRLKFVWFYGIIGVFVLLLACINFMNLSTARSEKRSKEVGIRKSVGSLRKQLITQFLSESFMVAMLSFVLALFFVYIILPWFNDLAGKDMNMLWTNPWFWLCGIGFIIVTALLAGSYPAFYLSSFKPVKVLKSGMAVGRSAATPRRILVVFQFTISIALITGTIIIQQQIEYVKNRPVGYSKEGLIMFRPRSPEYWGKYQTLRTELKKTGVVKEMAEANYPLTNTLGNNGGFEWEGKDPSFDPSFNTIYVTHEYGKTVGWEFVQGRDFSRDLQSDLSGIVITESALKLMQLDDPIGKTIHWNPSWQEPASFTILGVVKDMVKGSPFKPVRPSIIFPSERDLRWLFIRVNPQASLSEALPKIEAAFNRIVLSAPFDYQFVDELYNAKFQEEERIGSLAGFLAVLAIFISCLGLLGLVSYVAEQRTKEIGIRKVLGASVTGIWRLLTQDFVTLVIVSCLLAGPIAFYLLNNWLQKYDYRMEISWWIFILAGSGALVIALLTVSFQAVKSATANPVNSLRNE